MVRLFIAEKISSINMTARTAGLLYLLLVPLGIFGVLYVPATLIVPGNVTASMGAMLAHEMLFRFSIVVALVIPVVNIFVVLLLYKLLRGVDRNYAALMVIFLLMAVPIAYINELNQFAVLFLIHSASQPQALVSLFLYLHEQGIYIAQIFWGLWLLPMGYLVFKSGFFPKIIGVLLIVGGVGYLIDSFTFFLFPDLGVKVSAYTFIGEVVFPVWLLFKGVNVVQWKKRVQYDLE